MSYKVTTSIDSNTSIKGLQFPAITFCNANPYVKTKVNNFLRKSNRTKTRAHAIKSSEPTLDDLYQSEDSFFEPNLCIFGRNKYNASHFRRITTSENGNCYTFNPLGEVYQTEPGISSGLLVVFNIDQASYDDEGPHLELTSAAVEFTMHHHLEEKSLNEAPLLADPGHLNRFQMTRQKMVRAKDPYSDNCTDNPPISQYGCLKKCSIKAMLEKCGVVDLRTAMETKEYYDIRLPIADEENNTEVNCLEDFMHHYKISSQNCHCPIPCVQHYFEATYSQGMWPTDVSMVRWRERIHNITNKTVDDDYIKKNYVAIHIYYSDFHVKTTKHVPAFDWSDFLSALGGQIGLWIGASIYSVLELTSFLLELISYKFLRLEPLRKITIAHPAQVEDYSENDTKENSNAGEVRAEDMV